jgi:DNA-binding transcriptional ArsR family regulator
MPAETTKRVTDVRTLRAIVHPLRIRLLTLLRLDGPATATGLARRTAESSGATSYHLRQLERFGYVEEDGPRTGRERRWRATSRTTSWDAGDFAGDPEGLAVSDALERRQVQRAVAQFEGWVAHRSGMDPAWLNAATLGDDVLRLTPSQARALADELYALLRRYRADAPPPRPGEVAELVAVYLQLFPFEQLEELER